MAEAWSIQVMRAVILPDADGLPAVQAKSFPASGVAVVRCGSPSRSLVQSGPRPSVHITGVIKKGASAASAAGVDSSTSGGVVAAEAQPVSNATISVVTADADAVALERAHALAGG